MSNEEKVKQLLKEKLAIWDKDFLATEKVSSLDAFRMALKEGPDVALAWAWSQGYAFGLGD